MKKPETTEPVNAAMKRGQFLDRVARVSAAGALVASSSATVHSRAESSPLIEVGTAGPSPQRPVSIEDFTRVSEALTGISSLDRDIAGAYLDRWSTDCPLGNSPDERAQPLKALVDTYKQIVAQGGDVRGAISSQIMAKGSPLKLAAEQLIYIWYAAAFFDEAEMNAKQPAWRYDDDIDHYAGGLVWSLIGVTAPMTAPNGGPGHWGQKR